MEVGRGARACQVSTDKGLVWCDAEEHEDILAPAAVACSSLGHAGNDAGVEARSGRWRRGSSSGVTRGLSMCDEGARGNDEEGFCVGKHSEERKLGWPFDENPWLRGDSVFEEDRHVGIIT